MSGEPQTRIDGRQLQRHHRRTSKLPTCAVGTDVAGVGRLMSEQRVALLSAQLRTPRDARAAAALVGVVVCCGVAAVAEAMAP